MSKLFDLIKTGVLDVSVSPGNSFVKYTEQDLKWGGTNSWFQVSHILEDLPDSVNEEELVKEIISLLMDANYESDELIEKNNNEYEKNSVVKKESPRGYVYLMMNSRNGYIKIGFTKDYPTYRESTLQSQEPEIELINRKRPRKYT